MKTLIIVGVLLGATPVFAQNAFTTTQNPPAGKSNESSTQPTNSLPQASGTEQPTQQPGSTLSTTTAQPPATTQTSPGGATVTTPTTR